MKMTELQFRLIKANLKLLTSKDCFYKEKFKDIDVDAIQTQEDFEKRLKELGIKEEHIPTLKNMVGYGKVAETKKEEDSINNS